MFSFRKVTDLDERMPTWLRVVYVVFAFIDFIIGDYLSCVAYCSISCLSPYMPNWFSWALSCTGLLLLLVSASTGGTSDCICGSGGGVRV